MSRLENITARRARPPSPPIRGRIAARVLTSRGRWLGVRSEVTVAILRHVGGFASRWGRHLPAPRLEAREDRSHAHLERSSAAAILSCQRARSALLERLYRSNDSDQAF
jgi:hypothetical protein